MIWQWQWLAALLTVLLLYLHEVGHVVAAVSRRRAALGAPRFELNGGAFVPLRPSLPGTWDAALIALGGPIVGGASAGAMLLLGSTQHLPLVALVGTVMVFYTLANLVPVALAGTHSDGARALARPAPGQPALSQRGVLVAYLAVCALLLAVFVSQAGILGRFLDTDRGQRVLGMGVALIAGATLLQTLSRRVSRYAVAAGRTPRPRYALLALLGWAQPPYVRLWLTLIAVCALADTSRAPRLPLLETCLRRLHRFPTVLGAACAFGYDILRQRRDGQEEAWLDGATQTLGAAGPIAVESTALHLDALGYTDTVGRWLPAALARMPTTRLTPLSARNLAALLLKAGCMAEALPFAEVAVAREPDHPAVLATLGEVLLAVGRPDEAVGYLRASLARRDNARLRDILTRATAGQDHPDTTRDQTTQALE